MYMNLHLYIIYALLLFTVLSVLVFAVSEFASLTNQDHGLSLSSELFDGQLDNPPSIKQEADVLESLNIDAFDLAGFANANTACGTTTMYSQNVLNQTSVVTKAGVQNSVSSDSAGPQLQVVVVINCHLL